MVSSHGLNPQPVEKLGKKLSNHYKILCGSTFKNQFLRLCHMQYLIINNRSTLKTVIIDTFSTMAFWYAVTSAITAKVFGIKYILFLHGGNLEQRAKKNSFIIKRLFSNAYKVVCPSMFLKNIMHKYYPRNYQIIPNMIDLSIYKPIEKHVSNDINILWVRSLHEMYNPKMAIDVLRMIKKKNIGVHMYMVGPDKNNMKFELLKYCKNTKVDNSITFTGRLNSKEWIKLSQKCNFINTTSVDNTPLSVIESMALGIPVISTNVGGLPFLIKNKKNGYLVESGDYKSMADIIIFLKNDLAAYNKVRKNAINYSKLYGWENVKIEWMKILNNV